MNKHEMLMDIDKKIMNCYGFFLSMVRLPLYLKLRRELGRNAELKTNKKNNERCFVCGLGPSLRDVDFTALRGDTIVVNRFFRFDSLSIFKPTYYCIIDDLFGSPELREELFTAIRLYKDSRFLLNVKYRELLRSKFPENNNLHYLCSWRKYFSEDSKLDFSRNIPILNNSVCYAIALALYLDYKEIILLGCDFNSFTSQKSIHCYKEEDDERKISLGMELFFWSFAADTHYSLAEYARRRGVKIINATPGSLIDAYERDEKYDLYK